MKKLTPAPGIFLVVFTFMTLPASLIPQSYSGSLQDGIEHLRRHGNWESALYFFKQAKYIAQQTGDDQKLNDANLMIVKTQWFYRPYYELMRKGDYSWYENALPAAYQQYKMALDISRQNKKLNAPPMIALDEELERQARTGFDRVLREMERKRSELIAMGNLARDRKDYVEAKFLYREAELYQDEDQTETAAELDNLLEKTDCDFNFFLAEEFTRVESYHSAIEVLLQIQANCGKYFDVDNKIREVENILHRESIDCAVEAFQKGDHQMARKHFDIAGKYGNSDRYKSQLTSCYQSLFQTGKNLQELKNYDIAKTYFKSAAIYVNTRETQNEIRLCGNLNEHDEYLEKGLEFLRQEDISRASSFFGMAYQAYRSDEAGMKKAKCDNYLRYYESGEKKLRRKKIDKALEDFKKARINISTAAVRKQIEQLEKGIASGFYED